MTGGEVLDVSREAMFIMLQLAGPLMAVALIVGLGIAILQALTQIQEMTLTFVPKIVAIFAALVLMLPFMGSVLGSFMNELANRIAHMG
jgi:flagellar biosynthetic protein FliQ